MWATRFAIRRAVEGGDLLADLEPVLPQRAAGVDEVHDRVRQARDRRQLDRALDLDDLGPPAGLLEVPLRDVRVLGGDPQRPQPPLVLHHVLVAGRCRQDHPAAPVAQIEELVEDPVGLLHQDVLAGDPEVGRSRLDVGGHVRRAHRDQDQAADLEDEGA